MSTTTTYGVTDLLKDYDMEFNMSTVMQCVQELKAWQESQQQKLCENPTMDMLKNEMEDVLKSFDLPNNVQENNYDDRVSSYSEIDEEILNKFGCQKDIILSPVSNLRDDIEILSPNKNFGKMTKPKLINCDDTEKNNLLVNENELECNGIKPKKPYLKRGSGLARYGLNLQEVNKKRGKLKFRKPIKPVPPKIKVPRKCLNQVSTFPKTEFVYQPSISARLDLDKIKVADSWNRYEPKDLLNNEENCKNKDEQRELRAFELLEERANNSNFDASSPTVCQLLEKGQPSNNNKKIQGPRLSRSLNFDKINTSTPQRNYDDYPDSYSNSSQECDPLGLAEDGVKYMNINENAKQNNCKKPNQVMLTENENKYLDNYTKTSEIVKNVNFEQSFDTEILCKRLEELESEIETFRAENTKLMKLQREFEVERQKFFKSKDEFIKKMNEEKKREEEMMLEERKKFMKEKSLFEKNARDLKNKPNRQEREEIKQLQKQLVELKEEFNKKEARWATGQARLRTQMKVLENSNTALRSELELFRKTSLNKKVTFKTSERQALRNTKIIHNVNSELSKLTSDDLSAMIDPKTNKNPASILRKPVVLSNDNESSEDLSSDENPTPIDTSEDNVVESRRSSSDVIRETILDDGRKEILYSNGNLKKVSADGVNIKVIYYNGDVKETKADSERYYFAKNKTYHTTFKTGLEIIEFPNGQTEKHYKDGKVEIEYVDGKKHTVYPDRKEVWNYLDGSVLTVNPNGHRELVFLNGQREIHTSEYKKRVYPDGTTKIVYPDGSHETNYPDGRIRKKDKDGNLTLDTSNSS